MANRVIQQKLLKIQRARKKRRGRYDLWGKSNTKLEKISPLARPDMMKQYHGTMQALTYRDENFIKTMGLNSPSNNIKQAILNIRDRLEEQIPELKWIILRKSPTQISFLVWNYVHEGHKSRGTEFFLIEHHILLGLVKLSHPFESSASAKSAWQVGVVAWREEFRYSVES